MDFWKSISGTMHIRILSAAPEETLSAMNALNISLHRIVFIDQLTVQLEIARRDYRKILQIVHARGEKIEIVNYDGMYWTLKKVLTRPLFLTFVSLFFVVLIFLPTRVFFVRVSGNVSVPSNLIIEAASGCGVCFGAPRNQIRSEKVKNALIKEIPQLQWVGVNSSGCVATIHVREKSVNDSREQPNGISSVVAERDGVICDLTVLQGTPLCSVGQVVKKGQLLVSGYADCGTIIKATQAKAEVFAQTRHNITFISPISSHSRGAIIRTQKKYSIKIGKKLINFFNDSGILDATCVKMYEQKYITLPGGFQLPLALLCQTSITYDENSVISSGEDFSWIKQYGNEYLRENMLAGRILTAEHNSVTAEDAYYLRSEFSCIEMIGQVKSEESLQIHGKDG